MKKTLKTRLLTTSLAIVGGFFAFGLINQCIIKNNSEDLSQLLEDKESPSQKRASEGIVASGFNTTDTYNLNGSGHSIENYLESLTYTQISRERTSQTIRVNAPYTMYQSSTTHKVKVGNYVECSSGGNSSDSRTWLYTQDLENNDQPYISSTDDITIKGYRGNTFVENLSFTLTKGVSHNTKYYLQNLQINVTLTNNVDNYKVEFSNVHFTTGGSVTTTTTSSPKHVTTAYQAEQGHNVYHEAQYRYYSFAGYSKGNTYITGNGGSFQIPKTSSNYIGGSYLHSYSKTWDYSGNWVQIGDGSKQTGGGQYVSIDGSNTAFMYVEGSTSNSIGRLYVHGSGTGGSSAYSAISVGFSYSVYNAVENYNDLGVHGESWGNSNSYHHRDKTADAYNEYVMDSAEVKEVSHTDYHKTDSFSNTTNTASATVFNIDLNKNNPISFETYNHNVADVYEWYEAPTSGGEIKSFNTYETAFNNAKNIINSSKVQRSLLFDLNQNTQWLSPEGEYNFIDGFGTNTTKDRIYFKNRPAQTTGENYDVYVVPEYNESSGSPNTIKKLWAFKTTETEEMNSFIEEQAAKFVHYKTIFVKQFPASNYDGEHVVTNSNNYITSLSFDTTKHNIEYKTKSFGDVSFINGTSTSLTNTMYSYQNDYGYNLNGYSYGYKTGNYENEDWQEIASVQGTTVFTNIYNNRITTNNSNFSYVATNEELSDGTNRITFSSNDKMFVRITKNDDSEHATVLEANTIYNSSTTGYSSVASSSSPTFQFSEAGKYEIEMVERTGNNKRNITIYLYDEDELYANAIATNYQLRLDINNPASTNHLPINGVTIYEVDNKVEQVESRYYVESVNETPDITDNFHLVEHDDLNNAVGVDNLSYTFTKPDASYENQFHKTYYVEITLANFTKRYYIYWNYIQPDANNLAVSLENLNWESNVGYSVDYQVNFSYAAGEHTDTPNEMSQRYVTEVSNPNVIKIVRDEGQHSGKIRAIGSGTCSVTFSIEVPPSETTPDDILFVVYNFNITDTDELRKEIRISEENVVLDLGETKEITTSVNPSWKDQELTFTTSDPDVATFEDGVVVSHAPGTATITVHSEDPEIVDKVINVTVNELTSIFSNNNGFAFENTNNTVKFETHNTNEVTITSSNEEIGRYNSTTGKFEFVGQGIVTFSAEYYGVQDSVTFIVLQEDFKESVLNMDLGDNLVITYPNEEDFQIEVNNEDVLGYENKNLEASAVNESGEVKLIFTPLESSYEISPYEVTVLVSSNEKKVNNTSSFEFAGTKEDVLYTMNNHEAYEFNSSNSEVVSIENGKFNFNKPGTADITITYYGEQQILHFVVLDDYLASDVGIELGESKGYAVLDGVTFASDNNNVEISNGSFKGVKTGESEITISKAGLESKVFNVNIEAPEQLIKNENQIAFVGDTIILTTDAYDLDAFKFAYSKEGVATVNTDDFAVICGAEGTVEITATYYDQEAVLTLYIVQANLKENFNMALGEKLEITYSGSNLVFSSKKDNLNYSNKVFTAVDDGSGMITISVKNSDIKHNVSVNIVAPENIVENNSMVVYIGSSIDVTYLIADETAVKINISDKNVIDYDSTTKKINAIGEGKATLTFEYYDSKTILNFMVIKSNNVSFVSKNGNEKSVVEMEEVKTLENINTIEAKELTQDVSVDIPNGYKYTIVKDGQEYEVTTKQLKKMLLNAENNSATTLTLTEDGEYVLTIYKTYTDEEKAIYGEANLQEDKHVYKFKINKGTNTTTENEAKLSYGMEALIAPIIIGGAVVLAVVIILIATKKRKVGSMKK